MLNQLLSDGLVSLLNFSIDAVMTGVIVGGHPHEFCSRPGIVSNRQGAPCAR